MQTFNQYPTWIKSSVLTNLIFNSNSVLLASVFNFSTSFSRAPFSAVRAASWAPRSDFSFLSWMLFSLSLLKFSSSSFMTTNHSASSDSLYFTAMNAVSSHCKMPIKILSVLCQKQQTSDGWFCKTEYCQKLLQKAHLCLLQSPYSEKKFVLLIVTSLWLMIV